MPCVGAKQQLLCIIVAGDGDGVNLEKEKETQMRKKGFTLIELLVVIAIIAMLLAILMPALNKVKKIAQRVVCGTNLKGLGTAQVVYANDYQDQYTVQGHGRVTAALGNITKFTPGWANPPKPVASWDNGATIGASLYLLVREADVSPKSFVCPSAGQNAFDGEGAANFDITELWDFGTNGIGTGPDICLSYSFHHPYNRFAADGTRSAAFAVMSDRNPWYDPKLDTNTPIDDTNWTDKIARIVDDWNNPAGDKKWTSIGNAEPHDRDGQNVMFGDGHNAYEKRADVGVKHDNIFTAQGGADVRQGVRPTDRASCNTDIPSYSNDSFLVNDSIGG